MATTIDNKTVQMNFDNSNFERNISQSMDSLRQMDGQLQNMEKSKSLETLNKQAQKLDFAPMSKGLQEVKVHFSALQVAGATVIASLTKKVMSFGSSLVQNTVGQIKSGGLSRALNLDQAKFQIKGLGKEWEKFDKKSGKLVGGIKQDVLGAVSGTQYGLDEAAKIASQLISSNVKEGKELEGVLRSVAGVASMTNSSYADIGNLYAKIAGNGRMMSQELLQLSAKGMNAAAILRDYANAHDDVRKAMIKVGKTSKGKGKEVAEFANHAKLTEQNIRTLASAGAIDFNTFAKAMEKSFGKAASKANDTYAGSLANLKAALSRVGEEIQTPLYTKHLRKTYLDLIDLIDKLHIALAPLIKEVKKIMDFTFKKIRGVIDLISKSMSKLDASTKKTKELQKQIKKSNIYKQIKNISKALDKVFKTAIKLGKNLYTFVLRPIYFLFKEIGNVLKEAFFKNAKNGLSIFKTVLKGVYRVLTDVMLIMSYVINGLLWIVRILKPILIPALQTVVSLVKKIGSFLVNTFFNITEAIAQNHTMFTSWAENIVEVADTVKPVFMSIWKVIKFIYTSITNAIKYIFNSIKSIDSSVFDGFINGLSIVSKWITNFIDKAIIIATTLTPIFKAIWNLATAVFSAISSAISDLLKNMDSVKVNGFDSFVEGLKNVVQNVASVINKIAELIRKTKILEVVTTILSSVFKGVGYVLTNLTKVFTYVLNGISKFITKVREHFDIGKIFRSLIDTIKSGVSNLIKFLNQNGDTVLKGSIFALLITKLHAFIEMIKGTKVGDFGTFINTIKGFFTGIQDSIEDFKNKMTNLETLKAVAKSILMLAVSLFILSGIEKEKLNNAITAIISLFAGLLIAFKQVNQIQEISKDKKLVAAPVFKTLLAIAASILILSIALKTLSKIKTKDLYKGIGAITVLIGELVGSFKLLESKKDDEKEIPKIAGVMLALAASVRILASAIKVLAKIDVKSLIVSVGAISALLWELFGIVKLLSSEKEKTVEGAGTLIALSVSVRIIASAIKALADVKIEKLLVAVGAVSALLWQLFGVIKLLSTEEEQFVTGAATIIALSIGVRILVSALVALAQLSWKELERGLIATGALLVSVAAFTAIINKYGSMSLATAAGILIVAVAMRVLVASVNALANINPDKLANGMMAFITMLVSLAFAMKAMEGTLAGAAALGIAAAAIFGLSLALKIISTIPLVGLAAGLASLAVALYIISVAAEAVSASVPALGAVAGVMVLLGLGLALLGGGILAMALGLKMIISLIVDLGVGLKDIIVALVGAIVESVKMIIKGIADMAPDLIKALSILLAGVVQIIADVGPQLAETIVTLLVSILQTVAQNIEPIIQAIIDIIIGILNGVASRIGDLFDAIGNLLGAIGQAIIDAVGNINPEEVMKMLLAVGVIAIIFTTLSKLKSQMAQAIISVALMAVSLLILTGVFALLGMVDDSISQKLISISIFLAVMTVVLLACAVIGSLAAPAIVGLGVLLLAIGAITVVMIALGALADKIGPFIEKGGPLLIKIGSYIGQFIGAFIGGIAIQAVQALPALGDALGQFGQKIGPFVDAMNAMPLSIVAKIGGLIAAIVAITATSFMNKITTFLNFGEDPIDSFINMMVKLGKGLKRFNATIEGVDATNVDTASNVLLKLAACANIIPSSGGWLQKITGNKDLDGFGTGVVSMAKGLKSFVNSIDTSIDAEKYAPYVDLIKKVAEIANLIPRSGGWLQNIAGNKDLAGFGESITPLANGIKAFADKASEIEDPTALNNIIDIIEKMVKVQNKLPKSGGLWQAIAGEQDWSTLSEGLNSMVTCFKSVSKTLSGKSVNMEVLQTAVDILLDITKINNDAIKLGEKNDKKKNDGDSESFVSKIIEPVKKAVEKIKEYQKTLKEEDMTNMISYFTVLKNFINKLGSEFSDKKTQKNLKIVQTIGDTLTSLVNAITKIQEIMAVGTGKKKNDKTLATVLSEFAAAIVQFSTDVGALDIAGITNAQNAVDTLKSMSDIKISKFENAKTSVDNLKSMLTSFKDLNKDEYKLDGKATKDKKGKTKLSGQLNELKTYVANVKTTLKSMAKSLDDSGFKKKLKELSSFGKNAKTFSGGLKAVAEAFTAISNAGVTSDKGQAVQDAMTNVAGAGIDNFVKKLKGNKKDIKTAFDTLLGKVKKVADGIKDDKANTGHAAFVQIGKDLINGMVEGINSNTEKLKKALELQITVGVKKTKKKAKSNSPSKVYKKIGNDLMEGERIGIIEGGKKVQSALEDVTTGGIKITSSAGKKLLSSVSKSVNNVRRYVLDSLYKSKYGTQEYKGSFIDTYFSGLQNYYAKADHGVLESLSKKVRNAMNRAAETLYRETNPDQYNDEQAKLRNINKRVKKNQKVVDKFTKKKSKAAKKDKHKSYKIYKKWQSKKGKKKKKYFKNHKKTLNKYVKAKKKLKDAKKDRKDLRKTITDNTKSTWQDLANAIRDNAKSFMDPIAQAVDYGLNLFEKFERGQRISAGRMLANYASNIKGIEKYNTALAQLNKLAKDGKITKEMYAELSKQGISAMPQIQAILRMDSNQLESLRTYEAANKQQNFENMIRTLKDRIAQTTSWRQKIAELTKRGINRQALQEILNLGIEEAGPYLDALLSANKAQLNQFNTYFAKAKEEEKLASKSGMAAYARSASGGINASINKKTGSKAAWNYSAGIIKGLSDKKNNSKVYKAAYNLATQVIKGTNKRLGIKSPAKEGAKAMMYVALGMVKGASDNLSLAQNAGEELADAVLTPLQSMEAAQNVIDGNPTITPVLDLDRLESDMNELSDMFNNDYALNVAASMSSNGGKLAAQNTKSGDIINNYNNEFTQNNYSPEPLDRVGIYRDTKGWINSKMKGGVATT